MAELFQDPEKKKGVGDVLALALLGAQNAQATTPGLTSPQAVLPYGTSEYAAWPQWGQDLYRQSTGLPTEGTGQPSTPDPGVYGQMNRDERSTLGSIAQAMSLGNIAGGFLGVGPFGPIGSLISGYRAYDALGLNAGIRGVTQLTDPEMQSLADRFGWGMPGATPGLATDPSGLDPGWGSATPSTGFGAGEEAASGMGGGGGGPGGTNDGSRGGSDVGSDAAGTGGGWAKGGAKVFTRPARPLVAEGGQSELGIFIPEMMNQPGIQGREHQVRRALMHAMLNLR